MIDIPLQVLLQGIGRSYSAYQTRPRSSGDRAATCKRSLGRDPKRGLSGSQSARSRGRISFAEESDWRSHLFAPFISQTSKCGFVVCLGMCQIWRWNRQGRSMIELHISAPASFITSRISSTMWPLPCVQGFVAWNDIVFQDITAFRQGNVDSLECRLAGRTHPAESQCFQCRIW